MTSEYKHIYQAGSENLGLRRKPKNKYNKGTSLGVQWLRLHASTAGGPGLIPGGGTEIPHATRQG